MARGMSNFSLALPTATQESASAPARIIREPGARAPAKIPE
jgi:hypothetical protein